MVNWRKILDQRVGQIAVQKFVNNELSRDGFMEVFRAGEDRESNSQVRSLVRERGVKRARKAAREALRRRNLI